MLARSLTVARVGEEIVIRLITFIANFTIFYFSFFLDGNVLIIDLNKLKKINGDLMNKENTSDSIFFI